jgi:hypothetical protein
MSIVALLSLMICSCGEYELFEREQYKNVVAILSDDGYNIFTEVHDLTTAETEGYVSAVCGGSKLIEDDIDITMVKDPTILRDYNQNNYDVEEEKYANLLPDDKYDIADLNIKIPAGERTGVMKITVKPTGLSPDSTYFIPLRVEKFTNYELNPTKNYVMYRVMLKNYYATMKTATTYNYRGKLDNYNVIGQKQIFPVAGDKVRIVAGNMSFEARYAHINATSVLLHVDQSNRVHISGWRDLPVTQVDGDPDYPNIFRIDNDGYKTYKTFLLRYDYEYDGKTHQMQEELRLEFKEESEY